MFLVAGEALVDLTCPPDGSLTAHLGGGPFNTARALARLEAPTAYLGRLSTDRFGRQLHSSLNDAGADLTLAPDTDAPTTLAMAELDETGAASYRFYFDGTSSPALTWEDIDAALPSDIDALHLGTLGLVLQPLATTSLRLAEHYAGRALVFVDPNVRPSVIKDRTSYMDSLWPVLRSTDVVKVSDDDLDWLAGDDTAEDFLAQLFDAGAGTIFVTHGAAGVEVLTPTDRQHVDVPRVAVVDSIGAGDSFSAGVLVWWRQNDKPDLSDIETATAAARYGADVAAITVSRSGADSPRLDEL